MAVPANADRAVESESIGFNNSTATEADFETLCTDVVLKTTADVHIAFDRAANSSDFLLEDSDHIQFPAKFTKISALGNSGSGTLYILALR